MLSQSQLESVPQLQHIDNVYTNNLGQTMIPAIVLTDVWDNVGNVGLSSLKKICNELGGGGGAMPIQVLSWLCESYMIYTW